MPVDQLALARLHRALDELHHRAGHAMRDMPEDHPEPGRRLALALAGVDDNKALLTSLGGHDLVTRGLLLGHLLGVPCIVMDDDFGGLLGHFAIPSLAI